MTDPIQLDLCRSSKPEKQMALFCKFGLSWENKWKSVKTSGTNLESPALSSTQRQKIISKNEMSYVQPLVPGVKSTDCVMKKGSETLHDKQEKIGGQRVLLSKAPLTSSYLERNVQPPVYGHWKHRRSNADLYPLNKLISKFHLPSSSPTGNPNRLNYRPSSNPSRCCPWWTFPSQKQADKWR